MCVRGEGRGGGRTVELWATLCEHPPELLLDGHGDRGAVVRLAHHTVEVLHDLAVAVCVPTQHTHNQPSALPSHMLQCTQAALQTHAYGRIVVPLLGL